MYNEVSKIVYHLTGPVMKETNECFIPSLLVDPIQKQVIRRIIIKINTDTRINLDSEIA